MATYEDDHNLPSSTTTTTISTSSTSSTTTPPPPNTRRHRLNISDFFSSTPSRTSSPSPNPSHTSAFATLAAAFSEMAMTPVMEDLLATLRSEAENPSAPSSRNRGVPDGWTDGLERVGKTMLKPDDMCAICNCAFLDDPYPLVVRLPCHDMHVFDLECIAVWLKLHSTCPLDRTDLLKKKEVAPQVKEDEEGEEEEEEWDDNYG